jgi:hypothetical protein
VSDRHPLASDGVVRIIVPGGPLFSADVLDQNGVPVLPRQQPFEKRVSMRMTQGNSPDRGAFVDLEIDPPQALQLVPVDGDDSCVQLEGGFRCTADKDGNAAFVIRSMSDYFGEATIAVVDRQAADKTVIVSPAGLPPGSQNLQLVIEGVTGNRVQAKFDKLKCLLSSKPDSAFDKWDAARIRHASLRATPPPTYPDTIENAPVIIDTESPEVFVTKDPKCGLPHTSRLRVRLDKVGHVVPEDEFYLCFSDIGGENVGISATSGGLNTESHLFVDPEPRLLRVHTIPTKLFTDSQVPVKALEVSAYDSDLHRVGFDVEVTSSDKAVLALDTITVKLLGREQGDADIGVNVFAVGAGEAKLSVRPALHSDPTCDSELITVEQF